LTRIVCRSERAGACDVAAEEQLPALSRASRGNEQQVEFARGILERINTRFRRGVHRVWVATSEPMLPEISKTSSRLASVLGTLLPVVKLMLGGIATCGVASAPTTPEQQPPQNVFAGNMLLKKISTESPVIAVVPTTNRRRLPQGSCPRALVQAGIGAPFTVSVTLPRRY